MNKVYNVLGNCVFLLGLLLAVFSMSYINMGTHLDDGFSVGAHTGVLMAMIFAPITLLLFLIGKRPAYLSVAVTYLIIAISVLMISVARFFYYVVNYDEIHIEGGMPPETWQNVVAISISILFFTLCFIQIKRQTNRKRKRRS